MNRDKISQTQLTALLWAGALAPAAELLPSLLLPDMGGGAWLAVLAAAPAVLLAGWLMDRAAGETGLSRGALELAGPVAGRLFLNIYIVWAEVLLSLRLRLCAQRLLSSGERDGSLLFFLLGAAALALWMGAGTLPAFARAGQLFLTVLLCTALVVLGLSLFQVKPGRLLPREGWEARKLLRSALSAAGVLGWGLFAGFLTGRTEKKKGGWRWLFWGGMGCVLLALAQAVILGSLGATLAGKLDMPFFALAKSIGVEGAFQRVEALIAALWTFADLAMAGVLVFALREMTGALLPRLNGRIPAWGGAALGTVLAALPVWSAAEEWSRRTVPGINLVLALAGPGLLCFLRWARGKWK